MANSSKSALITGGAGFIGSHLAAKLLSLGWSVTIFDNLSSGLRNNLVELEAKAKTDHLKVVVGDCNNPEALLQVMDSDAVFHFAANPEIRLELNDPKKCFRENVQATFNLLEAFRSSKARCVVFASTSTVYGEPTVIPTPESYGPLMPISIYGASKLASEALVASYCSTFKKKGIILRFANVVGPRSRHGVVYDFVQKLKANPNQLEILGDGTQRKSYLFVDDLIDAIVTSHELTKDTVSIFNIGPKDWIRVSRIAELVASVMDLSEVKMMTTGGIDNGRGWIGDVKNMLLDASKLNALGWKPRYSSEEAILLAAKLMHDTNTGRALISTSH